MDAQLEQLKERIKEKMVMMHEWRRDVMTTPTPAPRYDDLYWESIEELDRL
jgi:hypothetical protein